MTTSTDLTITEKTNVSLKINSSTGADVVLLGATKREAGLLISSDKTKLDNTSGINTGDKDLTELGGEPTLNKKTNFDDIDHVGFPTVEATENRIAEKIAEIVNSSPALLDTLAELADAIGNDENFSATMAVTLGERELLSNKVTDITGNETSTTKYASIKAIIDWFTSSRIFTILGITATNTEINYLSGVTSSVQNQLNLSLKKEISYSASDVSTALTVAVSDIIIYAECAMTITDVMISLGTVQTSGAIFTVDIKKNGTTIFSTKPTIDNTEYTNLLPGTPAVLSITTLAKGDRITTEVTQVGDGTAKQLGISINGTRL